MIGYTFIIGNAVPEFSKDKGNLQARWVVQPMQHPDAPTFPNDETTGNGNIRIQDYSVWHVFCRATGINDVFYDEDGYLHAGHPGCRMLNPIDLERAKEARRKWQKKSTLPPGFDGLHVRDKKSGYVHTLDKGKYDAHLARLIWLEWWFKWALENCETPAIENY